MKRLLERLPRMIAYAFMAHGITSFIGIPVVGRVVAGLLDGVAHGAEATAELIRYGSAHEAHQAQAKHVPLGARIENIYHNNDGSVAVRYDLSAYTGQDISDDTLEALGEGWI